MAVTVVLHASFLEVITRLDVRARPTLKKVFGRLWKPPALVLAVLGVKIAIIVEIWVWALFFYFAKEPTLNTLELALYYSTSSFTTVGYGDIVLSENWRLLGSFESLNGMILLGWSTAFLFEVITDITKYDRKRIARV